MVVRTKPAKDRARKFLEILCTVNITDWEAKTADDEYLEHLLTRNIYQKVGTVLSADLVAHKQFVLSLLGGQPPPIIGSAYGFLSHEAFTNFVSGLTNALFKVQKTDQSFENDRKAIIKIFQTWLYDSGTLTQWAAMASKTIPESHKWVIKKNNPSVGGAKKYMILMKDTLSIFLASYLFAVGEQLQSIIKANIEPSKYPSEIIYDSGELVRSDPIQVSAMPMEASLMQNIRAHSEKNSEIRTQGLSAALAAIDTYYLEFEAAVNNCEKFKSNTAQITETNKTTFKAIFIMNLKEVVQSLFLGQLKHDSITRIEHLGAVMNSMLALLAADNITFQNSRAMIQVLSYLQQFCNNLPTANLSDIFEKLSLGGTATSEEKLEPLAKSDSVFFTRYANPPIIQSDRKTTAPFVPPVWQSGELHKHIMTTYTQYCVSNMVSSWTSRLKGIFYLFKSQSQKLEFQELILDNISDSTIIQSKIEFEIFVKKICVHFDKLNYRSQEFYIERLQDKSFMCQRTDENMRDFLARIEYTQALAYPDSFESAVNRRLLCKYFWRGLRSDQIRSHLEQNYADLVLDKGQAKELLFQASKKEDEIIRFKRELGSTENQTFFVQNSNGGRSQGKGSGGGYRGGRYKNGRYNNRSPRSGDNGGNNSRNNSSSNTSKISKEDKERLVNIAKSLMKNKNLAKDGSYIIPPSKIPEHHKSSIYYQGPAHYCRTGEFKECLDKAYEKLKCTQTNVNNTDTKNPNKNENKRRKSAGSHKNRRRLENKKNNENIPANLADQAAARNSNNQYSSNFIYEVHSSDDDGEDYGSFFVEARPIEEKEGQSSEEGEDYQVNVVATELPDEVLLSPVNNIDKNKTNSLKTTNIKVKDQEDLKGPECNVADVIYDTGSKRSIVSFEVWDKIYRKCPNLKIFKTRNRFYAADGSQMACKGAVRLSILIGKHTWVHDFTVHIVAVACRMLLGEDFQDNLTDSHGGIFFNKFYHTKKCELFTKNVPVDENLCFNQCRHGDDFAVIAPFTSNEDFVTFKLYKRPKNVESSDQKVFHVAQKSNNSKFLDVFCEKELHLKAMTMTTIDVNFGNDFKCTKKTCKDEYLFTSSGKLDVLIGASAPQRRVLECPGHSDRYLIPIFSKLEVKIAKGLKMGKFSHLEFSPKGSKLRDKDVSAMFEYYSDIAPFFDPSKPVTFPLSKAKVDIEVDTRSDQCLDIGAKYGLSNDEYNITPLSTCETYFVNHDPAPKTDATSSNNEASDIGDADKAKEQSPTFYITHKTKCGRKFKIGIRAGFQEEKQMKRFQALAQKVSRLFFDHPDFPLLTIKDYKAKLGLKEDAVLPNHKPIPLAPAGLRALHKLVLQLMKKGVYVGCKSPYACRVMLVRKSMDASKVEKFRLVQVLTQTSLQSIVDNYTLPSPKELVDSVPEDHGVFASYDLVSAFHQVELEKRDQMVVAFRMPHNSIGTPGIPDQITSTRAIMGHKNSGSALHFAMQKSFGDIQAKCNVRYFFDDIMSSERTESLLVDKLEIFLTRLEEKNFTLHPDKSYFGYREIVFAGLKVGKGYSCISDKHLKAIKELERPKNTKQARALFGMLNFMRSYTIRFSEITAPLIDTFESDTGGREFLWKKEQQDAFDTIRKILLNDVRTYRLVYGDPKRKIHVYSDASKVALGAALLQPGPDGNLRLVAAASRKLSNDRERGMSIFRLESLAICFAARTFRHLLISADTEKVWHVDSHSLFVAAKNVASNSQMHSLIRDLMDCFRPSSLVFVNSEANAIADYFSRKETSEIAQLKVDTLRLFGITSEKVPDNPINVVNIIENVVDPELAQNIKSLAGFESTDSTEKMKDDETDDRSRPGSSGVSDVVGPDADAAADMIEDRIEFMTSCQRDRVVTDPLLRLGGSNLRSTRGELLDKTNFGRKYPESNLEKAKKAHKYLHLAPEPLKKLCNISLKEGCEIRDSCLNCKEFPAPQRHLSFQSEIRPVAGPMKVVNIDVCFMGKNKQSIMLVGVDLFSRFTFVERLHNETSTEILRALSEMFKLTMYPEALRADNCTNFRSIEFISQLNDWNITLISTCPKNSDGNSVIERKVRTIKEMACRLEGPWYDSANIQKILFKVNFFSSTVYGCAPASVMFGFKADKERLLGLKPVDLEAPVEPSNFKFEEVYDQVKKSRADAQAVLDDLQERLKRRLEVNQVVFYRKDGNSDTTRRKAVVKSIQAPEVELWDLDTNLRVIRHMKHVIA